MGKKESYKQSALVITIILSLCALGGFLFQTKMIESPLILIGVSLFIVSPYAKESTFVKRLIILISLVFIYWILTNLGFALLPFAVSFLIAYLLDPFVSFLSRKRLPRWLASLVIVLIFVGIISTIAVLVFPLIFNQLDDAIRKITFLIHDTSRYLESRQFYRRLQGIGLPTHELKDMIQTEFVPKIQGIFSYILNALLTLITKISTIATQIINAILIPILSFYFLKDFPKLKRLLESILAKKNEKLLYDIKRINRIFKIYIGWQATAAVIVGATCSLLFTIFGLPYPIVLGVMCGFLNPIPYLGIFSSMIICFMTVVIVNPDDLWREIIIILIIINSLHFINAYFLEPNIAGKQVGLHPVLLIASLFIFGGFFGFLGLLVAVPSTAAIMMFFNDWRVKLASSVYNQPIQDESTVDKIDLENSQG